MSSGSPFRPGPPAQKAGGPWLWMAAAALLLLAWIWWRSAKTSPAPKETDTVRPAVRGSDTRRAERGPLVLIPVTNHVRAGVTGAVARAEAAGAAGMSQKVLAAQLALARQAISPGSLDGALGSQTRAALRAFQHQEHLPVTGELDAATQERLAPDAPLFLDYAVTAGDLARLLPLGKTWLARSQQERLDYETILELVAEKSRAHPNLIRRLNPGLDWSNVVAGTVVKIPNAEAAPPPAKAAFVKIFLAARLLEAFDENTNLLAHFPCSIAQRVDKRPLGELRVEVLAPGPNYTFNPEVFPESAEARELGRKLILAPGPNNPVGTVWIGLDRPGYGIHGTPRPEDVGRTESHGCFRLANWNAEHLLKLVSVGTLVIVEP